MRGLSCEDKLVTERLTALQRSRTFETGLLIAHLGVKGDTLLHLAPTPQDEDSLPPSSVDSDWMAEHATQVSRMLPGGIAVIGCYTFAATAKLSAIEAKLQPMLASLVRRLPAAVTDRQAVLLQLPSDSKKVSCRALAVGSSRLQPVDLKSTHASPQARLSRADAHQPAHQPATRHPPSPRVHHPFRSPCWRAHGGAHLRPPPALAGLTRAVFLPAPLRSSPASPPT